MGQLRDSLGEFKVDEGLNPVKQALGLHVLCLVGSLGVSLSHCPLSCFAHFLFRLLYTLIISRTFSFFINLTLTFT